AASSSSGIVISSGVIPATIGKIDSDTAAVTSPAPARSAASEAIDGAPDFPFAPPTTSTCPYIPLLLSAARGSRATAAELPAHTSFKSERTASSGDPIGATTIGPYTPPATSP